MSKKVNPFDKYFVKYTKVTSHQGGSIPFWDWEHSGKLIITTPEGEKIWLNAAEIIALKKILTEYNAS